jgi:hypothetical protein
MVGAAAVGLVTIPASRLRIRQPQDAVLAGHVSDASGSRAAAATNGKCGGSLRVGAVTDGAIVPVELFASDQGGDVRERPRPRQRRLVVARVIKPLTVDERDRRFEHRHSPLWRPRGPFVWARRSSVRCRRRSRSSREYPRARDGPGIDCDRR